MAERKEDRTRHQATEIDRHVSGLPSHCPARDARDSAGENLRRRLVRPRSVYVERVPMHDCDKDTLYNTTPHPRNGTKETKLCLAAILNATPRGPRGGNGRPAAVRPSFTSVSRQILTLRPAARATSSKEPARPYFPLPLPHPFFKSTSSKRP